MASEVDTPSLARTGSAFPWQSWVFWCGLLFGAAVGLQLAAVFVEWELLSVKSKAWVSVLGTVLFAAAIAVAIVFGRRSRALPGTEGVDPSDRSS